MNNEEEVKNENDMLYHIYHCVAVRPTTYNIDCNSGRSFDKGQLNHLYDESTPVSIKVALFEKYLEKVDDTLTIIRKQLPDKNWYRFEEKLTSHCEMNRNKNLVLVALCGIE